jgi:hypothetical protein
LFSKATSIGLCCLYLIILTVGFFILGYFGLLASQQKYSRYVYNFRKYHKKSFIIFLRIQPTEGSVDLQQPLPEDVVETKTPNDTEKKNQTSFDMEQGNQRSEDNSEEKVSIIRERLGIV